MPLYHGMLSWPTDPKVEISDFKSIAKGARSNVSLLKMGSHTGTHMDAPRHFLPKAKGIDSVSLDILIGTVRVIEIKDAKAIRADELKLHAIRRGERILFKTRNSSQDWQKKGFNADFVYLSLDAAKFLARRGVALIGVDYLSIGGYGEKQGVEVHQVILGQGIAVVEGLNLSKIKSGA